MDPAYLDLIETGIAIPVITALVYSIRRMDSDGWFAKRGGQVALTILPLALGVTLAALFLPAEMGRQTRILTGLGWGALAASSRTAFRRLKKAPDGQ